MAKIKLIKDTLLTVVVPLDRVNRTTLLIEDVHRVISGAFEDFELLIVDNHTGRDGISNNLLKLQERLTNVRILALSKKYSLEIVYAAALENAIGDYVVIINLDMYSPSIINKLYSVALEGYDVVMAKFRERRKKQVVTSGVIRIFSHLFKRVLGVDFRPERDFSGILSRTAVNAIVTIRNKKRFIRYSDTLVGLKTLNYYFTLRKGARVRQQSPWNIILVAFDILISNSNFPLRLASLLGLTASFLSLSFLVYVFIVSLVKEQIIEGWITTSVVSGSLFLILFVILTLLSEYVGRILSESKDEPLYFIRSDSVSSGVTGKDKRKEINVVN